MAEYIERSAAIRALTLHDCDSAGAKIVIRDTPADREAVALALYRSGYTVRQRKWKDGNKTSFTSSTGRSETSWANQRK